MGLTRQQITMVVVLMAGALLGVLNQTLLTPALPSIMSHLDVSATTVQWLTSGYALTEAVIIPMNAYLLGRFSTRKLFIGGISLFTVGSILCACAPNFGFLLFGRICQATATGVVMPTVFSLVLLIFPRENRGTAMGIIGLVIGFAPAVGPSVSGVLVDTIGWRALFVLIAALALIVLFAAAFALKNFEGFSRSALDVPSVILMALGMVSLLYAISSSTSSSNVLIPVVLGVFGLAMLAFFTRRQLRLSEPLLSVRVLKYREFRIGTITVLLLEAVLIGSGVILPIFVQNALGESATISGLLMLPGAVIGAVCGLFAGRIFDRRGIRGVSIVGICILILGVGGYFSFAFNAPLILVAVFYGVACIGIQCLITPVNSWGLNAVPNRFIPHANAIVSTVEQVGASLGTAFVVSLTALSTLLVPADADAALQSFAGCHIAFAGLVLMAVAIGVVIIFFMRDKPSKAPAQMGLTGVPGVDRAWLVSDVMNTDSSVLSDASTVGDAIAIMQSTETGGLPVVRADGTVAAFISDGDILKRLSLHDTWRADGGAYQLLFETEGLQERLDNLHGMKAMELATSNVISVDANDNAEVAFKMLAEKRVKKVPVLRDGIYVGTLSRRNVMKALALGAKR